MVKIAELLTHLDEYLSVYLSNDYCHNGLQIEGAPSVKHIVSGVSFCEQLIDEAIKQQADTILVHHGAFWQRDAQQLIGFQKNRIAKMLGHNINLLAYHLPLDRHPLIGNNALLCKKLGIVNAAPLKTDSFVWAGTLEKPIKNTEFSKLIESVLGKVPQHCAGKELITKVALCSGGGQNSFLAAIQANMDAYISGEASLKVFDMAHETGVNYYAAGHHATEKFGVEALGKYLAQKFGVKHEFVDIINPL